jgi:hypothetical protein
MAALLTTHISNVPDETDQADAPPRFSRFARSPRQRFAGVRSNKAF